MKSFNKTRLHYGGAILFLCVGFCLLAFKSEKVDFGAIMTGLGALFCFGIQYIIMSTFFNRANKSLIISLNMLCVISLVMIYRLETNLGVKQLIWICVGLIAMVLTMRILLKVDTSKNKQWLFIGLGIGLLLASLIFGSTVGGAQNWIKFEKLGISFQPSEFVKIILIFALAYVFREKRSLKNYAIAVLFTLFCVLILFIAKDLGAALLYFFVFVIMLYVGTNSKILAFGALGAFSAGAYIGYLAFDHVVNRVEVWLNPWADPLDGGYQLIQGLISMVSGGAFGTGLGIGSPRYVPAYDTDYIFTAICEEMGIVTGLLVIGFYILITIEGLKIAYKAENKFLSLIALGSTSLIAIQSFIIIGGIIKLIPLTGITLPFVSYGGSSVVVFMILMGIIQAVAIKNTQREEIVEVED